MKKLQLISSLILILALASCSQSRKGNANATFSSTVFQYNGPHDSIQLKKLLMDTINPSIAKLDTSIKSFLVNNMLFIDGLPRGFKKSDENLKKLLATNAKEVFTYILGNETLINTFETRPEIIEISVKDFNNLPLTKNGIVYKTYTNFCTNCTTPASNVYTCCDCCGGSGCLDYIVNVGDKYYSVK